MQEINLLQNKVKDRTLQFERSNRLVISIFVLILILEIVSAVGLYLLTVRTNAANKTVTAETMEIQRSLAMNDKDLNLAKGLQAQLKNVRTLLTGHVYWTKFFDQLSTVTPVKVQYSSITGAITDRKFHIEGMAPTYSDVGRVILSLSTSPNFSDVKLLSVSPSQGNKFGYSFSVDFSVTNNMFEKP